MSKKPSAPPVAPNEVENPIINSPFVEPKLHWHIERGRQPVTRPGRRPASYYYRVPEAAARGRKARQFNLQGEVSIGESEPLPLVNWLRGAVKRWREGELTHIPHDGASRVTKELLELWNSDNDRRRERLFYAQKEAAETIIFLVEASPVYQKGMPPVPLDKPGEKTREAGFSVFTRYASKMATGTGKTTVMAMLSAWSILNRRAAPTDDRFSDTVLIICPNITIRERLGELDPLLGDISLYRTRQLVPPHLMDELRRGEVMIANWHRLAKKEANTVNGDSAKVVKIGEPVEVIKNAGKANESREVKYCESDKAWFSRIRRELGSGKGQSPQWLVFNDEAHHAWRRGDGQEVSLDETETRDSSILARKNAREATVWIQGLDRINKLAGGRKKGINLCIDLSATPFYIQGSGNEVGKPFPWIVSDFGLLDAIESGLVKVPQLPTRDTAGEEESSFFNIWRYVEAKAEADGLEGKITPKTVLRYASRPLLLLAADWHERYKKWMQQEEQELHPVPPVFIVVCRDTRVAAEVYAWLAEGEGDYGASPEYFHNQPGREVTVRVDSKVVEDMERGTGNDEVQRLRFILGTIGKKTWPGQTVPEEWSKLVRKHNDKVENDDSGLLNWVDENIPPGRDIRCIVSVAMLSEGWDANTVTHIAGLRPFGSQLLCEQVLGRALRRRSYALNEADLFAEETARVFGVPFELVPFKVSKVADPKPPKETTHIFSCPEKEEYAIEFPIVEGFYCTGEREITIDYDCLPQITLDPKDISDEVELNALTAPEGNLTAYGPGEKTWLTLQAWREQYGRLQKVAFKLAALVCKRWEEEQGRAEPVPLQMLFSKVVFAAQRFLQDRSRLICLGSAEPSDLLLAGSYCQKVTSALYEAVRLGDATRRELPIIPKGDAGRGSSRHVDFHTTKEVYQADKSHLNLMVADTKKWEQSAAYVLDRHEGVIRWVKNEQLGFYIPYRKETGSARYIPDFIAVLDVDLHLIIEIKGRYLDSSDLKARAAERWVQALERDGRFGHWRYVVVRDPADLPGILDTLCSAKWEPGTRAG